MSMSSEQQPHPYHQRRRHSLDSPSPPHPPLHSTPSLSPLPSPHVPPPLPVHNPHPQYPTTNTYEAPAAAANTKRTKTRHRVPGISRLRKPRVLNFRPTTRISNRYGSLSLSPSRRNSQVLDTVVDDDDNVVVRNIDEIQREIVGSDGSNVHHHGDVVVEDGQIMEDANASGEGGDHHHGGDGSMRQTSVGTVSRELRTTDSMMEGSEWCDHRAQEEDVVKDIESLLRHALILCVAYTAGALFPRYSSVVRKMMELLSVAWSTCVVIIAVMWWKRRNKLTIFRSSSQISQDFGATAVTRSVPRRELSILTASSQDPNVMMHDEELPLLPVKTEEEKGNTSRDFYSMARGIKSSLSPQCVTNINTSPSYDEMDHAGTNAKESSLHSSSGLESPDEIAIEGTAIAKKPSSPKSQQQQQNAHPELEPLYVMNKITGERFIPNTNKLIEIDSDLFYGNMLMMFRTSDADSDETSASTPRRGSSSNAANDAVTNYFRTKQRRWEFQFQLKLKRLPTSPIYLGIDVDDSIKLGMIQKALMGAIMNFVKKNNAGMSYSLTEGTINAQKLQEGRYEKNHVALPVESSMDRFVATKPGEPLPQLGEPIYEDPASIKKRKKGDYVVDWNIDHTYTFGLWSAYIDYLKWKILNIPGVRPIALSSVIGSQPLNMAVYSTSSQKHYQCDIEKYVSIELSLEKTTVLGPCAKKYISKMKENRESPNVAPLSSLELPNEGKNSHHRADSMDDVSNHNTVRDDVDEECVVVDFTEDFDGEDIADEEEAVAVEELGVGMYLKSGDKVVMREFLDKDSSSPDNSQNRDIFVANGGGFAVLQSQSSASCVIEKAGSARSARRGSSKLIKSGDAVMIKLISGDDPKDVRYLSLHRGYWLKWVSRTPRNNGYFNIFTQETEGDVEMGGNETQTTYLTLGGSFSLRHRRWRRCVVGVSTEQSVRFGGRMLGLHRLGKSTQIDEGPAVSDDDDEAQPHNDFEGTDAAGGKGKKKVTRPLFFCADIGTATISGITAPSTPRLASNVSSFQSDLTESEDTASDVLQSHTDSLKIDVPAWIEMMHRTNRKRQRAYIVRITKGLNETPTKLDAAVDESSASRGNKPDNVSEDAVDGLTSPQKCESFIRVRTGEDLTQLLRLGLRLRGSSSVPFGSHQMNSSSSSLPAEFSKNEIPKA
uniref:Domain of unknown function at the cortex 1 domain-containing protein n=3 Tax=Ditylum brightwellii TaxID=49249 RepID=A0A7S4RNJ3_9STRA